MSISLKHIQAPQTDALSRPLSIRVAASRERSRIGVVFSSAVLARSVSNETECSCLRAPVSTADCRLRYETATPCGLGSGAQFSPRLAHTAGWNQNTKCKHTVCSPSLSSHYQTRQQNRESLFFLLLLLFLMEAHEKN